MKNNDEKEKPKETIKSGEVWKCPSCNSTLCNDVNFCCECGQRLSWSGLYGECEEALT